MPPTFDVLISNCDTSEELLSGIYNPLRSTLGKQVRLVIVDDCGPIHDYNNLVMNLNGDVELYRHEYRWGVTATMAHLLQLGKAPFRFLGNSDLVFPDAQPLFQLAGIVDLIEGPALIGTAEGPRFLDEQAKPYTLTPTKGEPLPWTQDYVSACALLFKTSETSGKISFSPSYSPGYYEDSDLSYSMRCAGGLTLFYPTTIAHLGNTAIIRDEMNHLKTPDQITWEQHKENNRLRFLKTWGPYLHPRATTYEQARANWDKTQRLLIRKGTPC